MSTQTPSVFLSFKIGTENVVIDIHDITRVDQIKIDDIYPIPKSSKEVLGMYRDNMNVFPVFDLYRLLSQVADHFEVSSLDLISHEKFSVIIVNLKGITAGLCFTGDLKFIEIEDNGEDMSENFDSQIVGDDGNTFHIIDIEALFPNIQLKTSVQESIEDDELDLSQYVLDG